MMMKFISEREASIVSVELVLEYVVTKPEAVWFNPDNRLPSSCPSRGHTVVKNLKLRYRKELPLDLKRYESRMLGRRFALMDVPEPG